MYVVGNFFSVCNKEVSLIWNNKFSIMNLMKIVFYIFTILFLVSCKNKVAKIATPIQNEKVITTDTVAVGTDHEIKWDTVKHISKPFEANKILLYWEKNYVIADGGISEIYATLRNYNTKKLLIEVPLDFEDHIDNSDDFYNKLKEQSFQDYNFDGFDDISVYLRGSMAMTSMNAIYIFNSKTKTFSYSEELSDTSIDSIDTVGKKLTTSSEGRDFLLTKTHYFNTNGTIKYTEVIQEYSKYVDSVYFSVQYKLYEKIVNGKVVETKKDSIIYTEN